MKNDKDIFKKLDFLKVNLKAFILDYDGTISDPTYDLKKTLLLFKRIIKNDKLLSIITARGASGLLLLKKPLLVLSRNKPIYLGCGNGTILYKIFRNKIETVYKNNLNFFEIKQIINIWNDLQKSLNIKKSDLNTEGVSFFSKLGDKNWKDFIPNKIINLSKHYKGSCFAEESKISIVLPKDKEKHKQFIDLLQNKINKTSKKKYLVVKGSDIYCHITHTFDIDPKLYALQTIIKKLNIKDVEVFVCGDMPMDNDKGILIDSNLPFTFTNKLIPNWDQRKPPFFLSRFDESPVDSVYKTIDYLLS